MRDGVREAFVDVVATHAAMPREQAEAYVDDLETRAGRYRPDLSGADAWTSSPSSSWPPPS
jgi:sulfite reductase alpha subunit-like flavoprotein